MAMAALENNIKLNTPMSGTKERRFHTDRGCEFKNQKMDELLETFEIGRSLSQEGLFL